MLATDVARRAGMLIDARRDRLAREVVERHYATDPQAWEKYGREGWRKSIEDAKFHFEYLAEALKLGEPRVFVNYAGWASALFRHLRLPNNLMETTLDFMLDALRGALDTEEFDEAADYIRQARNSSAPVSEEPFVNEADQLGALAHRYLNLLIQGRRREALESITDASEDGASISEIYLEVLQPVLRETGRLWHRNELDIHQTNFISASTELAMSLLYPLIFAGYKKNRHMLAACVQNELHQIGLRMVSDLFELDGWYAYAIGANVPEESIVRAVVSQETDVLAVSITMTSHLTALERLVERVKQTRSAGNVRIMVGGFPFLAFPDLWKRIGADGTAPDATAAVKLANQWMA